MSIELIIFLIALAPVAFRAWVGWKMGASFEMRHTLVHLFALLAALRFWNPATETVMGLVSLDPQFVAAALFAMIYILAALVAGLAVNIRGEFYQSVAPNLLDHGLGVICGLLSGAFLGGAMIMLCGFVLPGKTEGFDAAKFPGRFDQFPIWVFQAVETEVAGIPPKSTAATVFPKPPKPAPPNAAAAASPSASPEPVAKQKYEKYSYDRSLMKARGNASVQLSLSSAFRLNQLDEAIRKAQAENKLLGFIQVWDVFFASPGQPQERGGESALVHFHEVFKDNMVLVFVTQEELGQVPEAVTAGFNGPDNGGFAPNMAVVTADAKNFVCEIPLGGGKDSDGIARENVFRKKTQVIDAWIDANSAP